MSVTYKDIAGFPGFRVGDDGSVWSSRRGEWTPCRLYRRPYGSKYVVVCLRAERGQYGKVSCRYVHRLVLEAFVGPCPSGMECRHFPDSDTRNNSLENLSWGTHVQNIADKNVHGTARRTHCKRGHELPQPVKGKRRRCVACYNVYMKNWHKSRCLKLKGLL